MHHTHILPESCVYSIVYANQKPGLVKKPGFQSFQTGYMASVSRGWQWLAPALPAGTQVGLGSIVLFVVSFGLAVVIFLVNSNYFATG